MRYSDFVVPLVKAVQELDDKNQMLQNENEALRREMEILKTALQEYNKKLDIILAGIPD